MVDVVIIYLHNKAEQPASHLWDKVPHRSID